MKDSDTRLRTRDEIAKAIEQGAPVYADCLDLPERLPVRDVKKTGGFTRVRLLEGWRIPLVVYISHSK